MRHFILFILFTLVGVSQTAAQDLNYKVSRDSAGFILINPNGQQLRFDTGYVSTQIRTRDSEAIKVEQEIKLLEELIAYRRRLDAINEERKTLINIITQARQCNTN
jgi:hypothetical protein